MNNVGMVRRSFFKPFLVSGCVAMCLFSMYVGAQSTVPKSAAVMDFEFLNDMFPGCAAFAIW